MELAPIDEMSLRHLFSSNYAWELLHISYLGPVLNAAGGIDSSPDCIVIDARESPHTTKRCEFKYDPLGAQAFAENGRFDIAIVWALPQGLSRQQLTSQLLAQNGCAEVIVLSENAGFAALAPYDSQTSSRVTHTGLVTDLAMDRPLHSVFALCVAAELYPDHFNMDSMTALLAKRFPEFAALQPRGRAGAIAGWTQTKPALLARMHGAYYRWTGKVDAVLAASELRQLLTTNFRGSPPVKADLAEVR